jgi:hypothetical protein
LKKLKKEEKEKEKEEEQGWLIHPQWWLATPMA